MPIYTNKHNIPPAIYNALVHDSYVRRGDYSGSQLPKSPRAVQLGKRHDHEIVIDASERLWSLLGRAMHNILEQSGPANALKEQGLMIIINGAKLSGTPDLWTPITAKEGDLDDYKVTGAGAMAYDKPEWEAQLNTYEYMINAHGFTCRSLNVRAILRDWMIHKLVANPQGYPAIPFQTRTFTSWGQERQKAYIEERINLHQTAAELATKDLPRCTKEELWQKGETWAVMKVGNKQACRGGIHSTPENAEQHASTLALAKPKDTYNVVFRPALAKACAYCSPRDFCDQYAELKADGLTMEIPDGN
jgi:hypothetical protein